MKITRRQFVKASVITGGCLAVLGGAALVAKFKNMDLFSLYVESELEVLTGQFGKEMAAAIQKDAIQRYETLLPELPFIGGEENLNSENLIVSAYILSTYRVLRERGQDTVQVGRIIYDSYATATEMPDWMAGIVGNMKYGEKNQELLRQEAEVSQLRRYPGDWVFTYLEGDGVELDYGLDFTECGICKLYHEQGIDELTPYLCLMDEVVSRAFDRGLVRYHTLAEGDSVCDFRFKSGRDTFVYPLRDGWPPRFRNDRI